MDLSQLKTLSALKYQHSQQALSGLLKRENELRAELERMRMFARKTQAQEPEDANMRAVGADVIWLGWVGKVQQELNMALANVLAKKEALIAQHRRANGRKIVAQTLADNQAAIMREEKEKASIQSAIDSTVFGSWNQ